MSIQRDNSLASLVQYGAEAEDSDAEAEPDFVDNISDEDEGPPSNQPALKRERDEADSEPTPPPVKKERRGKYPSTRYPNTDFPTRYLPTPTIPAPIKITYSMYISLNIYQFY